MRSLSSGTERRLGEDRRQDRRRSAGSLFATIAAVVQIRSLCALIIGVWLGAGILADVAVTQNFQAVDRFLAGHSAQETALERPLLRRNAAEENAWIFTNWERAELVLGVGLLFCLLREGHSRRLAALCLAMVAMVAAEHFFLTDAIIELGRRVDDLAPTDPAVQHFWILHGIYSGLDLLKLAVGFGLAVSLTYERKARPASERAGIGQKTGLMARG